MVSYRVTTDAGESIDIEAGQASYVTYIQGQKLLVHIEAVDAEGNVSSGGPTLSVGDTVAVSGPPVGGCPEEGAAGAASDDAGGGDCGFFPPVAALTWVHPISDPEQKVSSYRGWRNLRGRDIHSGIDVNSTTTTQPIIRAVADGTVAVRDECEGAIAIDHDDGTEHIRSICATSPPR